MDKEFAFNVLDAGGPSSIPGLGRSPGEGHGSPLPYSYLENSMAATVHSHTELDTNGST